MEFKSVFRTLPNRQNLLIIALAIATLSLFSSMIPPGQSPDEFDHLKRAYLLGKGQILLDTPVGKSSGGNIDSGLLRYFNVYSTLPFHAERKVSHALEASANGIAWTGMREFSTAGATGYYFPAAYAPQAIGLIVGEILGFNVDKSYRLARFLVLICSVLTLALAFSIYPTNPFVIALLILPMSIFQLASASLEAFVTALSIAAVSIFLRAVNRPMDGPTWLPYALCVSLFFVVSSRVQLLPLLMLPFFAYRSTKKREYLICATVTAIVTMAWLSAAIMLTRDTRVESVAPASTAIKFYLTNPQLFAGALINTLGNIDTVMGYLFSFVGVLGWLDARFSDTFYWFALGILTLVALCTVSPQNGGKSQRMLLAGIALASCLLIFFALAVAWNPLPTSTIQGVQGRYFLVPLLLLGYALPAPIRNSSNAVHVVSITLVVVLAIAIITIMPDLLLHRYFISN